MGAETSDSAYEQALGRAWVKHSGRGLDMPLQPAQYLAHHPLVEGFSHGV